jgi:hypothetical protein
MEKPMWRIIVCLTCLVSVIFGAPVLGTPLAAGLMPRDALARSNQAAIRRADEVAKHWDWVTEKWAGGVVPTGVTSTADSGNYTYTDTSYGYQKFANFLYGIDTWGTGGYVTYGEQLFGTFRNEWTIGVWTYTSLD